MARQIEPLSFNQAFIVEKEGSLSAAAKLYEKLFKKAPQNLDVLARLMIVYRKLKQYDDEIRTIDKAINIHRNKYISTKEKDTTVMQLSKKINKLLGHTSSRGKDLLAIPEVEKLEKRRAIVLKKKKNK